MSGVHEPGDQDIEARGVEVPGDDAAIAAVVAGSAGDHDAAICRLAEAIPQPVGCAPAGVFHEGDRRQAESLGLGVDPADLGSRQRPDWHSDGSPGYGPRIRR
jgi:hypothetical protein